MEEKGIVARDGLLPEPRCPLICHLIDMSEIQLSGLLVARRPLPRHQRHDLWDPRINTEKKLVNSNFNQLWFSCT